MWIGMILSFGCASFMIVVLAVLSTFMLSSKISQRGEAASRSDIGPANDPVLIPLRKGGW
jgi:hypothetical protein